MRGTAILVAAAIVVAGVGAIVSAAAGATARNVTCAFNISIQRPSTPPTETQFGFIRCGRPLGRGIHFATFNVTSTSSTSTRFVAKIKDSFDKGTLKATLRGASTAASATDITYTSTLKITGGTGAFRNYRGTGTVKCTSSDSGAHKRCTSKLRLRERQRR